MKHLNVVGVDLAKNIIQVSVVSPAGKRAAEQGADTKEVLGVFSDAEAESGCLRVLCNSPLLVPHCSSVWPHGQDHSRQSCYAFQARSQDRFK